MTRLLAFVTRSTTGTFTVTRENKTTVAGFLTRGDAEEWARSQGWEIGVPPAPRPLAPHVDVVLKEKL